MQVPPEPLYCGDCKTLARTGEILTVCLQCSTTYHITCVNVAPGQECIAWICRKCDAGIKVGRLCCKMG